MLYSGAGMSQWPLQLFYTYLERLFAFQLTPSLGRTLPNYQCDLAVSVFLFGASTRTRSFVSDFFIGAVESISSRTHR